MRVRLLPVAASIFASGIATVSGGVITTSYSSPTPIAVAPGQIITFSVSGIGAGLTGPVRASTPAWPTTIAGISATYAQFTPTSAVPILAVEPIASCSDVTQPGCTSYTAITVQVPFEMQTNCPGVIVGNLIPPAQVRFAENGTVVASVDVNPVCDQIHLLRTCDLIFPNRTGSCDPVVTHADGSPVTGSKPAQEGEEIVIYGVGLGGPSGEGLTGKPPSSSLRIGVGIGFDYRPNAGPTRPSMTLLGGFVPAISPLFSGMVPGFVGLYQINVTIPQPPAGFAPCDLSGVGVDSNLTINVGKQASFDGVGICVQPSS